MALPTWRNVAINSGAGSAALGNSAANFGKTALQGLSIFNDQMQERIDREDEQLTNQAIAAKLAGVDMPFNQRVDQGALYGVDSKERALVSDLLTAQAEREKIGLENQGLQFKVDNQPETYLNEQNKIKSEIAENKSGAGYKNQQTQGAAFELGTTQRDDNRAQKILHESEFLTKAHEDLKKQVYDVTVQEHGYVPGQLTPEQEAIVGAEVDRLANGVQGRQILKNIHRDNNMLNESWLSGSFGAIDAAVATAQQDAAAYAAKQRIKTQEAVDADKSTQDQGSFRLSVYDPKTESFRTASETEQKEQALPGNYDRALKRLRAQGFNTRPFENPESKENQRIMKKGIHTFEVASIAAKAMEPFIIDGDVDVPGLDKMLDQPNHLLRLKAINEARKARGMSQINAAGTTESVPDYENQSNSRIISNIVNKENVKQHRDRVKELQKELQTLDAEMPHQLTLKAAKLFKQITKGTLNKHSFSTKNLKLQELDTLISDYKARIARENEINAAFAQ